jgi:hypothetical protein
MFDLEVWLIGTPAELDTAARALARIGRVVNHGPRIALAGADAGRCRTYARIRVLATVTAVAPAAPGAPELAA